LKEELEVLQTGDVLEHAAVAITCDNVNNRYDFDPKEVEIGVNAEIELKAAEPLVVGWGNCRVHGMIAITNRNEMLPRASPACSKRLVSDFLTNAQDVIIWGVGTGSRVSVVRFLQYVAVV
jgi:hypothetical protein